MYVDIIKAAHPGIEIVEGTHVPRDFSVFQKDVSAALCAQKESMADIIKAGK